MGVSSLVPWFASSCLPLSTLEEEGSGDTAGSVQPASGRADSGLHSSLDSGEVKEHFLFPLKAPHSTLHNKPAGEKTKEFISRMRVSQEKEERA